MYKISILFFSMPLQMELFSKFLFLIACYQYIERRQISVYWCSILWLYQFYLLVLTDFTNPGYQSRVTNGSSIRTISWHMISLIVILNSHNYYYFLIQKEKDEFWVILAIRSSPWLQLRWQPAWLRSSWLRIGNTSQILV